MEKKKFVDYGIAVSLTVQSAATIVLSIFLGWAVDDWCGTSPLFIIVLAILGFVATLYSVYKRLMAS